MTSPDPRLPEALLRLLATRGGVGEDHGEPGPCPEAGLLAGLASGELLPAERERTVAHVTRCDACLSVLAGVVQEVDPEQPERAYARRPRFVLGAAAAVAAVILLVWLVPWRDEAVDTDRELARLARELAEANPTEFAGFHPLSATERRIPGANRERGGRLARSPVGAVLTRSPAFSWRPIAGASEYEVVLSTNAGAVLWRRSVKAAPLAFPGDEPALDRGASYLWEISGRGVLGVEAGAQVFAVASPEEAERYGAMTAAVAARVPPGLRALLIAHVALRAGLLDEAERYARAFVEAHPEDVVGRETLFQVLTRQGAP